MPPHLSLDGFKNHDRVHVQLFSVFQIIRTHVKGFGVPCGHIHEIPLSYMAI